MFMPQRFLSLMIAITLPCIALGEDAQSYRSTLLDEKTWTFSAGLGSTRAWNLVGISKELLVSNHASVFATAGLGEMVLGAGVTFYGNRGGNGVVASAVAGTGTQLVLTYRWKLANSDYLAAGATYIKVFGFSDIDHSQTVPVLAYEHCF